MEAAKNRYWRAEDAEVVLAALAESQLSVAAFSREHGLSAARVQRWRERLRESEPRSRRSPRRLTAGPNPSLRFHPVRVMDLRASSVSSRESEVELLLAGDRRIVVRRGFDAELLQELVRVVESWPRC